MKYLRYIFIIALVLHSGLLIKGIVSPEITFTSRGATELSSSEVDPQLQANAISAYRTKSYHWLSLTGLILSGWVFLRRKKIVFTLAAGSLALLSYIIFDSIRGLGYTMSQSMDAASQGYGLPIFGWNWFYLVALAALLLTTMKKAEQGGGSGAEPVV
ncbi:hypothetical protein [Luteolibacter sp. AS25]|uniref:hypothetical protein n=1 Tax=Luteolibacter sp. AS25 TaxID=3135776 RepID=UPI00398B0DD6